MEEIQISSALVACGKTFMRSLNLLALLVALPSSFSFQPIQQQRSYATSTTNHAVLSERGGTKLGMMAAATSSIVLPSLKTVALSCLLPTSLGFAKIEYGVGYGYGLSVALSAFWIWKQLIPSASPLCWHASALVFYGARLTTFLLYRELCIPRFRKLRETIEEKRSLSVVKRIPFVLSCALLYACMAAPVYVTSSTITPALAECGVFKGCIVATWVGFIIAAFGDLQKSVTKSIQGEDTLVTNGVFTFLRHPNYTGEMLGWTASFAAAVISVVPSKSLLRSQWPLLSASVVGWLGIVFVLCQAATGLEKKQRETYGDQSLYQKWLKRSWAGPTFTSKT